MALDFNKLLENPLFQTGLATLGGAGNPGLLNAYQALQAQKKAKLEQQQQEQQMELERARTDLYRQQIEATKAGLKQKEAEAAQNQRNIENFPELLRRLNSGLPMEGQGSVTGSPMATTQSPQAQPGLALPPEPFPQDIVWGKMLKREDGVDPRTGAFRTSPKGAIGPGQVLPTTAPEAAQLAGLPWDENKFRTDPAYNTALGRAYYDKQTEDFGNLPQAAAAYNAGPGAVREAIKRSEQLFKNPTAWFSFLPQETKAYVINTTGYGGGAHYLSMAPKKVAAPVQTAAGPTYDAEVTLDDGKLKYSAKPSYKRAEMAAEERRHQENLQQRKEAERRQQQEADIKRDAEERQKAETTQKLSKEKADATAAYRMGTDAVKSLDAAIEDLQKDPGLGRITGLGALTNRLAIPGQPAHQALSKLEGIQAKLIHDVLQATRNASANGASGYGQFVVAEMEVVKKYIENLDPGRKDFKQALQNVRERIAKIQQNATEQYKAKTGGGTEAPMSLDDYLKSKGAR